jgi:hypothetical protein
MEEAKSSNYNSIGNELGFNVSQLDGQSFHAVESGYPLNLIEDEINNNNGTKKTPFPNLTSTWLNDFTSVGNSERFGFIDSEIIIDASEGFPDKTDSEGLANGLSISHLNIDNRNGFTGSQEDDTNNGQLIGNDFVFSKAKHFDLVREGICKVSPKNRKSSETLTKSDEIDDFVKAFDEPLDENIPKMRKDRPVESAYFEMRKLKHSGLVSNDERENMNCIQTDPKRKRTNINYTVGTDTTNLASSKEMIQLSSVTGRDGYRIARTRKRRSETRFSTNFVDYLSAVPSPEAEVPSLSSIATNKYIQDDDLVTLDTKELNRRMKSLPKTTVQEIKYRRRTLKNRGYARSCREKKNTETSILQKSKGDLEKEFASTSFDLQLAKLKRDEWKSKYEHLASALKQGGVQVQQ